MLDLSHAGVSLRAKAQLDLDKGFEAGVQVRHAQVDELRQFREELVVEGFVGGAGELGFALGAGKFAWVFVWFFHQFFYAGASRVVVEQFVVTFFYAYLEERLEVGIFN